MNTLREQAHEIRNFLTDTRRRLHAFAECGFSLSKTTFFVKNALQSIGYTPKDCGKSGIVCELSPHASDRPFVLLRADMDALPIEEQTHLPFRAENGNMHACGHDMHTAMLLGAAAILKEREATLPSPVRFVFEPAEEILSGAEDMKENDVLANVGAALMLHAVTAVPFPTGTLLLPPSGFGAPAACFFEIEIRGKSAHVGEKDKGIDALEASVTFFLEMQKEKERMGEGFLLSVGKWQAGDAPNILPAKAVLAGSFRSFDTKQMERFQAWLIRQNGTTVKEAVVHIRLQGRCPRLKNDPSALSVLKSALTQSGFSVKEMPRSEGSAAEDFAVFASRVPAAALAIAAGERERGYEYPLHHPRVLFDEDAIPIGAAAYAEAALALGGTKLQTFTKGAGA